MSKTDQKNTGQTPRPSQVPADGYMRLPSVLGVYPVSKSSWWNGVKAGTYPAPVRLGKRMTAWRASDIRALIDDPK